jgi:predicted HTH transcriptional regulator
METFTQQGKTVVVIRIGEFPVKPVNTRGRYFKRVASSNHQLTMLLFAKEPIRHNVHIGRFKTPRYGST